MSTVRAKSGVIIAGLALFSMFFGAGDLIWPLILGGQTGDHNFYAVMGLLISGVSLPLLGLISMTLFGGDYRAFFGQTGKVAGAIILFAVQMILGPFGSLPRLFTLAYASIHPYLDVSLLTFSLLATLVVLFFVVNKRRVIDLLGMILTPLLLLSIGAILVVGLWHHPAPEVVQIEDSQAFMNGLHGGYSTLDLIASFIFAPVVFIYFQQKEEGVEGRRKVFKKMVKASLIAGGLLSSMYLGLSYLASYYTQLLPSHIEAEKLGLIALHLLGQKGAFFSAVVITLSCLTTAIPISLISAEYIQNTFFSKQKVHPFVGAAIPLLISVLVASLGFMGIAKMLDPVLQILCPGLIILSILNIVNKLYDFRTPKAPVFVAFGVSCLAYFVTNSPLTL